MAKRIKYEPDLISITNDIHRDTMSITSVGSMLYFDVEIDGTGNRWELSKAKIRKLL